MEDDIRNQVVGMLRVGAKTGNICHTLGVSRMTVCRVKQRLDSGEDMGDRRRQNGRKIDTSVVHKVMRSLKANPRRSMSNVAKCVGTSKSTVSRIVKKAGGKSLVLGRKPLLSEKAKKSRFDRAKKLLNQLKNNGDRVIFFSDEKTFNVDPAINRRNDRFVDLGHNPEDPRRTVSRTKHPASVMFLGVIASTGEVSPSVFFDGGYRLNAAGYIDVLKKKLVPWMKKIAGDRN